MTRRRRRRSPPAPRRPEDLQRAPETDAVRLPLREEPYRGERQDRPAERERSADAVGEGNVTELAQDMDDDAVRHLEKNAQKSTPRAAPHPHKKI